MPVILVIITCSFWPFSQKSSIADISQDLYCTYVLYKVYPEKPSLKQSGFCTTYYFKILVLEIKYKNNLKGRDSQKKHMALPRSWKWKSVFFKPAFSSRSENTGPVNRGHVTISQMRNETPLQLRLLLHAGTDKIFLFFRSQIH